MKETENEVEFRKDRISSLWDKIYAELGTMITPSLWINNIHDHKGCIQVTWDVKPTRALIATINMIWDNDFNEIETEHIFNGKRIT
jgi:hypothetical protein